MKDEYSVERMVFEGGLFTLRLGLYEQVINKAIGMELAKATEQRQETASIDAAEASKILSKYIAEVIEQGLDMLRESDGDLSLQVALINKIVATIKNETKDAYFEEMVIEERAEQLLALLDKKNNIYSLDDNAPIVRPETSIARSSLFTGAVREPQLFLELNKEIASCNRMDMLVSFIKWSGLRLIINELRDFTQNGGRLRVITTPYMGATDVKAIAELQKLQNTDIKVSYDTTHTRLHAKAYTFYRDTGFTTAYIGSSNLSFAALSSGLEWNIKVASKDLPETVQKIMATFESYWNSSEFETYTAAHQERFERAIKAERAPGNHCAQEYTFDITPYPFQREVLDQLAAERSVRNHHRNLVVAATGTGKTVISAFDYKNFVQQNRGQVNRLLFVAHREEILKQSLACFRGVLKDANFGDLFVGNCRPQGIEHLFMSIQTFNAQDFTAKTTPDFYDFLIIDEFHHAAAPTYQKLLAYYNPRILLGLTATPERMDGKSILIYFDNKIAAEIRLAEAINRRLLCPFQYFGVTDSVDLHSLKWARGGYDRTALANVYTIDFLAANRRAELVRASALKYVTDINEVKGLGFCVSIEHAKFMAAYFNNHQIPSLCLTGHSPDEERNTAKQRLVSGEIRFIFVVDLYNEGVDIPEVNTVLFLRPTESLTVFLQQLGRGLRLTENKECLTVLDFIGRSHQKYNFEEKFSALLSHSTRGLQREIKDGFVSVPKGCYIQLERKAKEYILENISSMYGTRSGLIARMATFEEDTGEELTLANFLSHYHMDVRNLYLKGSLARLCVTAGLRADFAEPLEQVLSKASLRICAIDSRRWISFLLHILPQADSLTMDMFDKAEVRMLQMFQFTVWQRSFEECGFSSLLDGLVQIKNCPSLYAELIELLTYNFNRIDFLDESVNLGFACPLDLHCTYTRDQILVALDFMKPSTVREGVKYLPEHQIDVFFVTLNKSDKDYSPTTMYNDYSINETLFHWQSQSTTAETSPTGQRYINHRKLNSQVLLFVRDFKQDVAGAAPYTFLGLAHYVDHEGGRPMNITWRLQKPIPAKFLKKTNKMVVG